MVPPDSSGAKTVPLQRCTPGEKLAKDVHNQAGQKVVPKDKKLTSKILRRLSAAGIKRVTVYSDEIKEKKAEKKKTEPKQTEPENVIKETADGIVVAGNLTRDLNSEENVVVEGNMNKGANLVARGDVQIKGSLKAGSIESKAVSYTHLTLPTNREV